MPTLQRATHVTEAQAHADVFLPPLRQSLAELIVELSDPQVFAMGWRDSSDRLGCCRPSMHWRS